LSPGLIDKPPPLTPLRRISPSRYGQLKACALREIWTVGGSPILLPRNPSAILGTMAHQLLKEAGQSSAKKLFDAAQRWQQLADGMNRELKQSWIEDVLSPLQTSAPMYEVLKIRACVRAEEISSVARKRSSGTGALPGTGFELWVESQDKSVGGWIDSVRRVADRIVLSDFKSGDVLEQPRGLLRKQLKESHSIQLKLYAALYFQTYSVWPGTIQIVPLTGATLNVPFTRNECSQLLDGASLTLKSLNDRISSKLTSVHEALATPSPQNCRFCSYRPACTEYRRARKHSGQSIGWPMDAFGQVWDINVLRDGRLNLRVTGEGGGKYTFRALSSRPERNPALQMIQRGDQVGIFNARREGNGAEFSEGKQTVLYKLRAPMLTNN
jgi:hypothetical protein